MGVNVDGQTGNLAIAMHEAGMKATEIAAQIGLSPSTVSRVIDGHGYWGKVAELPVAQALRREQQKILEVGYRAAAAFCLQRSVDQLRIDKASTYQLAIASKIYLESSRLLAGESTQNVSVQAKIDVTSLDALATALGAALIEAK